jgi:hypothetical protein
MTQIFITIIGVLLGAIGVIFGIYQTKTKNAKVKEKTIEAESAKAQVQLSNTALKIKNASIEKMQEIESESSEIRKKIKEATTDEEINGVLSAVYDFRNRLRNDG